MTACSACTALLPVGASQCPRCASPITAFAIPVVRRVARFPYWILWFGLSVIALLILGELITKHNQAEHEAKLAALRALSTPEVFQARCGKPLSVVSTPQGSRLNYGDVLVTFAQSPAAAVHFGRNVYNKHVPDGLPVGEDWALEHLSCGL